MTMSQMLPRVGELSAMVRAPGYNPHECCALIPGHENGFEVFSLTSQQPSGMIVSIAEVRTLPDWWPRPRG